MKKNLSKIVLLILIGIIYYSCDVTKKVPEDKKLLTKNVLIINDTVSKNESLESLIYQKPNSPVALRLYNIAKENPDSAYYAWLDRKPNRRTNLAKLLSEKQVDRLSQAFFVSGFSRLLKDTGEAPIIIDEKKVDRSVNRLKSYYTSMKGYFDVDVKAKIDSVGKKKGQVQYMITTGKQYTIDSIDYEIETPELHPLYEKILPQSLIKKDNGFSNEVLSKERERITKYFRNNGVYHFQVNNIKYTVLDTANPYKNYKLNVTTRVENQYLKKETTSDSAVSVPFKIYTIDKVNIFTDTTDKNTTTFDSISYNNFTIYSKGKLNYKPKALTNFIFIEKGKLFSDNDRKLTTTAISNLRIFNLPTIEYVEDTINGKSNLIANIYLAPKKKYSWTPNFDVITSNIQEFGISGGMSFTFRNIFKGAETLEISGRGNIGSSQDLANPNNVFFNISEYGANAKLTFPRIFFPVKTNFIRKEMMPTTQLNVGFSKQQNIGLDKQSLSGGINYNWSTSENKNNFKFELLNINYIRNLNVGNYFNVYKNSYNRLNDIAQNYGNPDYLDENGNLAEEHIFDFINQVLSENAGLTPENSEFQSVLSISERYYRLIEDNLIVSSSFQFSRSTKIGLSDRKYYNFRAKLESAGNLLSLIANSLSDEQALSASGNKKLFGIEYAQFAKGEIEFVKLWPVGRKNAIAFRSFGGIAIPYGNGTSIPFSRSYFAGGSNDNRGWQAYSLGPGRSGGVFDFNEANMKMAINGEYRFHFFGNLHGALFADAGNIWNLWDNVENPDYTFNGISSLEDIALGSGVGFRYDFTYFIFRLDFGYKTYNPGRAEGDRWFKDVSFPKTVLNFGINYPF